MSAFVNLLVAVWVERIEPDRQVKSMSFMLWYLTSERLDDGQRCGVTESATWSHDSNAVAPEGNRNNGNYLQDLDADSMM